MRTRPQRICASRARIVPATNALGLTHKQERAKFRFVLSVVEEEITECLALEVVLQCAVRDAACSVRYDVGLRVLSDQICSVTAAVAPAAPVTAGEYKDSSAAHKYK